MVIRQANATTQRVSFASKPLATRLSPPRCRRFSKSTGAETATTPGHPSRAQTRRWRFHVPCGPGWSTSNTVIFEAIWGRRWGETCPDRRRAARTGRRRGRPVSVTKSSINSGPGHDRPTNAGVAYSFMSGPPGDNRDRALRACRPIRSSSTCGRRVRPRRAAPAKAQTRTAVLSGLQLLAASRGIIVGSCRGSSSP